MEAKEEFKHIVRIANTDLDGNKPIYKAITKIKGISFMFSNMICAITKTDKFKKTGYLANNEIEKIDNAIKDPIKFGAPEWMFNRRRNYDDNKSSHLVFGDLKFTQDNDIKIMKKIKTYKGMRHIAGLPVRGQRTRSNFRKSKGKVSLGVKRREGMKPGRV